MLTKATELIGKSKAVEALKSIVAYIEKKKPKTLAEAEHMLALVGVIASESILEVEAV